MESPVLAVPVRNERRAFVSITAPPDVVGAAEGVEGHVEDELDRQLMTYVQEYGAEVVEDVR